ncbi:MAG: iron-sulfur cluster assembly accessory protein [candidate division Zixibacteria bacterium]|nr:iron-sulfur cluster assembly accessory protein [candidate division Zixibacteria bacterium]
MSENTQSLPTDLAVRITPNAVAEVKRLISEENETGIFLRLGVAAGGCSGMSYSMGFDTNALEGDTEYDFDGLTVRVDSQSLNYLQGTTLDYKGGMLGGGFQFSNPNAKRSCGCGSSFTC